MIPDRFPTILVEAGTENLFEDIGFSAEEAASLKLKSDLILSLQRQIEGEKFDLNDTEQILGVSPHKILAVLNGELDEATIEQLVDWLFRVGLQVKLEVFPVANSQH